MWSNEDIITFLRQAGLVDAVGNTLDMDRIVQMALSMEVPLATVAGALAWTPAQLDTANNRVLWWDIQRDLQTYPAHQVREMWAAQRGVAPSMFNRIYRENTGTDVPEPVTVNYVPAPPPPAPPPAVTFGPDGQPSLTGRDLLRYDATALGLSGDELLYRVYRSSIDKGVPLAVIRQQIAQKYDVAADYLDRILNARNPGIIEQYQAADDQRAAHVAWQAQPVPADGSLKPPVVIDGGGVYAGPAAPPPAPIRRYPLPGSDPAIPGGGGVVVESFAPGEPAPGGGASGAGASPPVNWAPLVLLALAVMGS